MINVCSVSLSFPLSEIFNGIANEVLWPSAWKTEHVTLIPKKSTPLSMADLRNISCTNFFSKVMESFLLQWTLDKVAVKTNQYGGVKGCFTTHMLLNIWQNICSNLEDYRSITVLTGERRRGALDSSLLGRSLNSSQISVNLAGDGDPLSKERAGKDRISMASLRQVGYSHLEKSPYRSGGNWGNGSLGRPLDPTAYDEGTEVHPGGVRIQSAPEIGQGWW